MSWLRLDDGFAGHPKIAALSDGEFRVWLRLLCYCGKVHDPTVDSVAIREVKGLTSRKISRYFDLELLDKSGTDFEVHDWPIYQPKDATGAERQARWRARRNASRNGPRNGPDRDETVTSRAGTRGTRPVPSSSTQTGAVDVDEPPPVEPPDYVDLDAPPLNSPLIELPQVRSVA